MATTTTNLGLKKPAYEDTVDVGDINGNMDILDSAIQKITGAIAVVENGDTATQNIPKDSYVLWKGKLYLARFSAISIGDTLSSANLEEEQNVLTNKVIHLAGRTLAAGDDFNNLPVSGVYPFSTGSANQPPINWGILFNIKYSVIVYQLAFCRSGMYFRDYTGDTMNWSSWKRSTDL